MRVVYKKLFIVIPLLLFFVQYSIYSVHKQKMIEEGGGFWKLQRNWEDMQRYVKDNTPKNAMILVPYNMEMGGFRIFSERKIVASYRDCGIIGFSYESAVHWMYRIKDIEPFKIKMERSPVTAIKNAVTKYGADYIVFMGYASPPQDNTLLKRIYTNESFVLFRVNTRIQ